MAGRTRGNATAANLPAATAEAGVEGINQVKQVRKRRSSMRGRKTQTAYSGATPATGSGIARASMGLATKGLMQYIVGRHAQGFTNAQISSEFTAALQGWTG